jgi:hypothetical protein
MAFLNNLATKESYEIPLAVGDRVTNVNVTILRNTEETGKVDISVISDHLGKVTASFSARKEGVNGFVSCDNQKGLDTLKSYEETIKQSILQGDVEVKQLHFGIESKTKNRYNLKLPNSYSQNDKIFAEKADTISESKEAKISTETLYKVAKTFLIQIKNIEMEMGQN